MLIGLQLQLFVLLAPEKSDILKVRSFSTPFVENGGGGSKSVTSSILQSLQLKCPLATQNILQNCSSTVAYKSLSVLKSARQLCSLRLFYRLCELRSAAS